MKAAALLFASVVAIQGSGIEISREITGIMAGASGTLVATPGCSKTDQYGSNDCKFDWGQTITGTLNATLPVAITTGATVSVDAKIDGLISWKFSCPVCGGFCVLDIPVVKKTENITMPPCPLVNAGNFFNTTTAALPSKSPVPVSVSFKGTAELKDASGTLMLSASFDGKL